MASDEIIVSEASAPGKLILFGEHAVVYGATAIACALSDLRIHVRVGMNTSGRVRITIPDITQPIDKAASYSYEWDSAHLRATLSGALPEAASTGHSCESVCKPTDATLPALEAATAGCDEAQRRPMIPCLFLTAAILGRWLLAPGAGDEGDASVDGQPKVRLGVHVHMHTPTLPVAAGLGSSAAFSVATAAALLDAWMQYAGVAAGAHLTGSISGALASADTAAQAATSRKATDGPYATPSSEDMLAVINAWAYSAEMLFHGSPSGLDNTVATYGGAIAYSRGVAGSAATINRVHSMPALRILVTNTKVPKETGKLVAGVRVLHDALPDVVKPILTSINAISQTCMHAISEDRAWRDRTCAEWHAAHPSLADSDGQVNGTTAERLVLPELGEPLYTTLQMLVHINHNLLNALGVGHAALEDVRALSTAHGFPCKLTGAGGGGCALTLLKPRSLIVAGHGAGSEVEDDDAVHAVATLQQALAARGYDCFETRLGGAGVLIRSR